MQTFNLNNYQMQNNQIKGNMFVEQSNINRLNQMYGIAAGKQGQDFQQIANLQALQAGGNVQSQQIQNQYAGQAQSAQSDMTSNIMQGLQYLA